MPKDSRLVARILSLWDHGSFWTQFSSETGTDPQYNQKMPPKTYRRPKRRQTRPADAPTPHYPHKAPSKRPNAASNMTGGKGPNVRDKLAAKATLS
jgi:hypothetical protein